MTEPTPTDATDATDATASAAADRSADSARRRDRDRWQRASDTGSLVWGVILLAIGGWFFVEHTLGYDLPAVDWSTIWPIVLIVMGGWIVLRAAGGRSA
jgi:hypothetical protein